MIRFEDSLSFGHLGERKVEWYLRGLGFGTMPSYDYSGANGDKAPKLRFSGYGLILPDLGVCRGRWFWAEVKTYSSAVENRSRGCLVHGMPLRLFSDYGRVEERTGAPVVIFVLEVNTGSLLSARLAKLETFGCQCPGCRNNRPRCMATIKRGVYWRRASMKQVIQFSDAEMEPIRNARSLLDVPSVVESLDIFGPEDGA